MKILFVLIACVTLFGCKEKLPENTIQPQNSQIWFRDADNCEFQIVTIEGCQYIYNQTHGFRHVLTHKGNCNNPIHKN